MSTSDSSGYSSTAQTHAGYEPEGPHRSIAVPIHATTAYAAESHQQLKDLFARRRDGYAYSRSGNPTTCVLERRVAALEGGIGAIAVASGQAAVAVGILGLVAPGDHLVAASRLYGGTVEFFDDSLADAGVTWSAADPWDLAAVEAAFTDRTRVLFVESIANPGAQLADIPALADIAHRHDAVLVVDNTVASPALLRPGALGADVVIHSATKYLGGHGAALAGVVVDTGRFDPRRCPALFPRLTSPNSRFGVTFSDEYARGASGYLAYARAKYLTDFGATLPAHSASLLLAGIETLDLRMERISTTTAQLAAALREHPLVARVHHPSSPGRPDAGIARRDFPRGTSGVFAIDLVGGEAAAEAFLDALELVTLAVNIGDSRSLAVHPGSTTHCHLTPSQRAACGVSEGTVRLSIGLEDPSDLRADLEQALVTAAAVAERAESASAAEPDVRELARARA
ncbi:O-acetylhomoserine aminocarboxypropyltransferase/cysteine synthase family protein [Brachybacterium hainanense]|uniref:O-acetylhomoserine aminocarboxypropyltransferase/cysteine synthase family protein n=1 Tax=Brachybacterium hainanense TaxID=1541174 RepID=A0ABV6RAS9_9MICO